jgi:hypothetical protein
VGRILTLSSAAASTSYTLYTYSFTANRTAVNLAFAMKGDHVGTYIWQLDNVSVNHTNASTDVLINGGFEMGNLTGWTQFCNTASNCIAGYYSHVVTNSCYSGTYCIYDGCKNYDYLEQVFPTVIGDYYLISYYLRIFTTGGPYTMYVILT